MAAGVSARGKIIIYSNRLERIMEKALRELTLSELEHLKFKLETLLFKIQSFEAEKKVLSAELETLQIKANTLKIKSIQSLIHKVQLLEDGDEILAILERVIQFKVEENRQELIKALDPIDPLKPL
jgi:hypothetical protein